MARIDGKGPENIKNLINDLTEELVAEGKEWDRQGISPAGIGFDQFTLHVRTLAILDALMEVLDIPEDELEYRYKKRMLEELKGMRPDIEMQLQAARERAIAVPRGAMPPISSLIGPDGKIIKH